MPQSVMREKRREKKVQRQLDTREVDRQMAELDDEERRKSEDSQD